eukprot:scaffold141742_cov35-Prasinocladus_malaysianus.AAC.1
MVHRSTYESKADSDIRRVPVDAVVSGRLGEPLRLSLADSDGHVAAAETLSKLGPASKRPMDGGVLAKALGKTLGGGVLSLRGLDVS